MNEANTLDPTPDKVKSILEAILFAASEQISLEQFSQLFDDVSTRQIRQQLMLLRDDGNHLRCQRITHARS